MIVRRSLKLIKREQILLFLIAALSLCLNTIHLNREGYGNLYYAAGVRSMLESWHNFFFVAYDPGGFVSIDKPPLGFWIQTGFAKLLGFHGWVIILPQVIAGVLSVLVLYRLVSKVFGIQAGLIAALILAITPISVATARNNTIDSLLVLTVLLAAWLLLKGIRSNSGLRWIVASAIVIGLGFNIKMLEAYLVLPAFIFILMVNYQLTWLSKLKQLSIAAVIMLIVSLAWAIIVDLIPEGNRPYIGSTSHNSVIELIFQHNAMDRFKGVNNFLRFIRPDLGGQISWLLPLALLSALFMLWKAPYLRPRELTFRQKHIIFWLMWLVPMIASFGAATLFHRYYTVLMAPAIAALVGVGLVKFGQAVKKRKRSAWVLFAAIPLIASFAITIVWSLPDLRITLSVLIGAFTLVSLLGLAFMLMRQHIPAYVRVFTITACMLTFLVGPLAWAITPAIYGRGDSDPVAGSALMKRGLDNPQAMQDKKLVDFLMNHYVKGRFLVATPKAQASSPLIINTGLPIITLGGYSGTDPILTSAHLQLLAQKGMIKYFLLPKKISFGDNKTNSDWIQKHCVIVNYNEADPFKNTTKNSLLLYQYTDQKDELKLSKWGDQAFYPSPPV
jgi:4-amino-4-deoxy-L-arabinose transferase-like glycosyltransferase